MNENNLQYSFRESLKKYGQPLVIDILESGLDANLNEGVIKEIPFISTAVSLYHIGKTVKERYHVRKMIEFIQEINKGIITEDKLNEYKKKFDSQEKFRIKELEYIVIIVDRYIGYNKPVMLARLYRAYLDGILKWTEFLVYSEVIDRFLASDFSTLTKKDLIIYNNDDDDANEDSVLRLVALGLMKETTNNSVWEAVDNEVFVITQSTMERARLKNKTYTRTNFGNILVNILQR